jgi:pyridinium-3,5-biscarboxylic acid mononucleotide sulfurtransferase
MKTLENNKLTNLINILKKMESAVLAFSGGADSAFLLKAMEISGIRTLAVTGSSEIISGSEIAAAQEMAKDIGVEHRVLKTEELSMEEFVSNSPERCFFCKAMLFKKLADIALSEGYGFILDGSNMDDTFDFRPGQKAASEYNVRRPLVEAGFSKIDVREFSKILGLPTWDKPSTPCLATRIPYGQRITIETLKRVARSEDFLRSLGFRQIRVRDHGCVARIEIGVDELDSVLGAEKRKMISETLKSFGYDFICLDLEGYRSGSMNRILRGSIGSWKTIGI